MQAYPRPFLGGSAVGSTMGTHGISANGNETQRAKLVVAFVVDTNQIELTIPFGN